MKRIKVYKYYRGRMFVTSFTVGKTSKIARIFNNIFPSEPKTEVIRQGYLTKEDLEKRRQLVLKNR